MKFVREHLSKGQELKAVIESAHEVPFPPGQTLANLAISATDWLRWVDDPDFPDSPGLRDIVGTCVDISSHMNTHRLLYREDAYDCEHEELWKALFHVHDRFNPDCDNEDWDCVFENSPGEGSDVTPDHLQVDHNRRAVLLQKEMALKKLLEFLDEKGHADLVTQFRDQLLSEVEEGTFPRKPAWFREERSHLT